MELPQPTRRMVLAGFAGAAVAICCGDHALHASPSTDRADDQRDDPPRGPVAAAPELDTLHVADGLDIHPRSAWGADLAPRGPMEPEQVEFLLVHHSASNAHTSNPRSVIRSIYAYHTGPDKRWPDVAYNFFVAPDGSVWEGRAGSLDGPVVASATGGNQGFSQLVCLLGNHESTPPTAAAQTNLVRTLAWLAGRSSLNTYADATATFVSRGSNKFPAGDTITTPIISPHRSVTYTECPGDAAVALLPEWRHRVFETLSATWQTDGLQHARRTDLRAP